MASLIRDMPAFSTSSRGMSLRIFNSLPSARIVLQYMFSAFLLFGPTFRTLPIISIKGIRYKADGAPSGLNPLFLSASVLTRCKTPTVSFFPQIGQIYPCRIVSSGVKFHHTPCDHRGNIFPLQDKTLQFQRNHPLF